MMKAIILMVSSLTAMVHCGAIDHHKATSYQNIQMEHFHSIHPDKDGHPMSKGKTESKLEVHHGNKHDPGYGVANVESIFDGHNAHHHFVAVGGFASHDHDHEEAALPAITVHKGLEYKLGDDGQYHHHEHIYDSGEEEAASQQQQQHEPEEGSHESYENDHQYE